MLLGIDFIQLKDGLKQIERVLTKYVFKKVEINVFNVHDSPSTRIRFDSNNRLNRIFTVVYLKKRHAMS